jgi:hypothetical protein
MLDIWGLFDDKDACYETVEIRYDALCEQPAYRDNHAEHEARNFRKRQKGHYKLRRSNTIDRAMKAEMMRQKNRKEARGEAHLQTQLLKL